MKIKKLTESQSNMITRKFIDESLDKNKYAVLNPDETFAGVPCESFEEARDMAAQKDGRVIFRLVPLEFDESFDSCGRNEKCNECGTLLNDMGTCPRCDYGDEEAGTIEYLDCED